MIIIHNVGALPRLVSSALARALAAQPVVVVTGSRQTGKSTLVREIVEGERAYHTLDDLDVLDQAVRDPEALASRAPRVTLDEVQRAPELLRALKRLVDRRRVKGQFLVTGSANLLLMRRVGESLAGRASYLTLWPMTRREQRGLGQCGLWEELLAARDEHWPAIVKSSRVPREDWRDVARRGGYPTPALELDPGQRELWFAGYTRTYLERDIPEIASIGSLPDLRRLMRAASLRVGQMLNQTELGRDVALPQPTVHRWLNVLEMSYQLVRLPAYAVNRTKRVIKTPKIYWCDTGLGLHLAGGPEPAGAHLENVVLTDLLAWRDARLRTPEVLYWRTASGEEVDFVIEAEGRLLPIEVKATRRPRPADVAHLQSFRKEHAARCRPGLFLHDGDTVEWIAPGVMSAPWWRVL